MFIEYIKKYERSSILINIIMIIVSLFLIFNPAGVVNTVVILFGLGILADGLSHLIAYFLTDSVSRMFSGDFFQGSLTSIIGLLIISNKEILISIFPTIVAIWLIIKGIVKLQLAFNMKGTNMENWSAILLSGIVTLILGALIISNPFSAVYAVSIIAGVILLISSIIDLIENLAIIKTLND